MKIENILVVCCNSITEPSTWYIFRSNGIEVKIVMDEKYFKSNKKLTYLEIEYLNNNLK